LRSFQQRLPEFNRRGIHVAGISVDSPADTTRNCKKQGLTYTFLCDTNREVTRRYDLLHEKGGPDGSDIARPAEFLIDSAGVIRWANLTESATVRARPNQVLKAFDDLKLGSMRTAQAKRN